MLSTTVDPASYRAAWLTDVDDPPDHSGGVLVDGAVIGTATLHVRDAMGQGDKAADSPWTAAEAGMGYALDPTWHGQGFGTAIVGASLSLTFDDVGLHRVTAGCFAGNIGSWRVMEKWGMRREQHGVQDSWHAEHGWVDGYT